MFLCKLDIRQESVKHTEAMDAVTTYLGLGSFKCVQRRGGVGGGPTGGAYPSAGPAAAVPASPLLPAVLPTHHLPGPPPAARREWDEERRMAFLVAELNGKRPLLPPDLPMTPEVADVIGTFRMLAQLPADSLGAYIISMSHTASDVLAVVLLQRECGGARGAGACGSRLGHCMPGRDADLPSLLSPACTALPQ